MARVKPVPGERASTSTGGATPGPADPPSEDAPAPDADAMGSGGDGEAAGGEAGGDQVPAPPAEPVETVAPEADDEPADAGVGPDNPPAPSAIVVTGLRVVGPARGRWRAGRHFTPEAVLIPADELTEADAEAIQADPELDCAWV